MESGVVCPVAVLGLPQFGLGGRSCACFSCWYGPDLQLSGASHQGWPPLGVAEGIPTGTAGVRVSDGGAQGQTQMGIVGCDSKGLVVRF